MQQLTIIGHIGKDATTKDGSDFFNFSVCVTESYKNETGERIERSTWYNIISKRPVLAQYLKKGNKVLVQGEMKAKVYLNDRKESLIDLTINSQRIELLTSKLIE